MDRKSLLAQVDAQDKPPLDEKKLVELVEEAAMLTSLKESRGWKLVYDQYIKSRISIDRYLSTKSRQQRDEVWGAMTDIDGLMKFIDGRITNGEKAAAQLEAIRGRNK